MSEPLRLASLTADYIQVDKHFSIKVDFFVMITTTLSKKRITMGLCVTPSVVIIQFTSSICEKVITIKKNDRNSLRMHHIDRYGLYSSPHYYYYLHYEL